MISSPFVKSHTRILSCLPAAKISLSVLPPSSRSNIPGATNPTASTSSPVGVGTAFQVFVSIKHITPSLPPDNNLFPSKLQSNPRTILLWFCKVATFVVVSKSQTKTWVSSPPVANINRPMTSFFFPFFVVASISTGDSPSAIKNDNAETNPPCPRRLCVTNPLRISHTLTKPSEPPVATKVPVGSHAETMIGEVCLTWRS